MTTAQAFLCVNHAFAQQDRRDIRGDHFNIDRSMANWPLRESLAVNLHFLSVYGCCRFIQLPGSGFGHTTCNPKSVSFGL